MVCSETLPYCHLVNMHGHNQSINQSIYVTWSVHLAKSLLKVYKFKIIKIKNQPNIIKI